jgi:hypothetical protein
MIKMTDYRKDFPFHRETEREMLLRIVKRVAVTFYQDEKSVEFVGGFGSEAIRIEFDENGNVTDIGV